MKSSLSNTLSEFSQAIRDYLQVHLDLARLTALEKTTKLSVYLITATVFLILGSLFFFFVSAAFVVWYGTHFNDYLTGLLIIIGIIIVAGILFYAARHTIVTRTVLKKLSAIFFDEETTK